MFSLSRPILDRLRWKLWPLFGGPRYDGATLTCHTFDQLLVALQCSWDADIRRAATREMGKQLDPRSVEPLIQALGDRDALVRYGAEKALEDFAHPNARGSLLALLQSPFDLVRERVIRALGSHADSDIVPPLLAAMADSAPGVRLAAIRVLAPLADPRVFDPLLGVLDGGGRGPGSVAIQAAAARALGMYRDPRAIDALARRLASPWFSLRDAAQAALGSMGWAPSDDGQRLALAVAACEWEAVATHGAAAARPLVVALREGNWDPYSAEPYEMDQARAVLEGILSEHAAELDAEIVSELAGLNASMTEARMVDWHDGWEEYDHVELGNCDRIREIARAELRRRGPPA